MSPRHRILFLDAYDSFSNNITSLLTTLLGVDVHVLPIDTPLLDPASPNFKSDFRRELSHYTAVVCGPGPGSPEAEKDVGLMRYIWDLSEEDVIPALGVCLGFQSLALGCGGKVRRLQRGLHGMVRSIDHQTSRGAKKGNIFDGVGEFKATLYHSLCVDIGQDDVDLVKWDDNKWEASSKYPDVVPLAWVEEDRGDSKERILMAMKHRSRPFWGVQYHPESVCTEVQGNNVIKNWFHEALQWNQEKGRSVGLNDHILARNAVKPSLLHQATRLCRPSESSSQPWLKLWSSFGVDARLQQRTIHLPDHVQIPDIVEILQRKDSEHLILDSANARTPLPKTAVDVRGQYSIIALDVPEALRIEHHVGNDHATLRLEYLEGKSINVEGAVPMKSGQSIWQLLAAFHDARRIDAEGLTDIPFLGGFIGYITYEQGLKDIGVSFSGARQHHRPDVCLAWVTKSIVVDHVKNLLYINYLHSSEGKASLWLDTIAGKLESSHMWQHASCDYTVDRQESQFSGVTIRRPDATTYEAKVRLCQDFIAAGDSYELCLTDQTTLIGLRGDSRTSHEHEMAIPLAKKRRLPTKTPTSWKLYRALRARQPAPFASYIRLGGATLVSSSPERFLQYDRRGLCSMKPMKGTVRKSDAVSTLKQAEEILHVPKEEAENLMIVDLVRHDLHSICGPGNVAVPELMKVEEYQSVFQMITVVEGQLPRPASNEHKRYTGLDVLAASLPPGSMTGAPKKRSCEILQEIEQHKERSLYSGVVGYMCVSGRGDWSVTIRSMFRWDDERAADPEGEDQEVWHIGAGGAVTILSTANGEREEMLTKLAGPLGLFR